MRMVLIVMALLAATAHAEKLKAPDGTTKDYPADEVDHLLQNGYTRLPSVRMLDPVTDREFDVPVEDAAYALSQGWRQMNDVERAAHQQAKTRRVLEEQAQATEADMKSDADGTDTTMLVGIITLCGVLGIAYWAWVLKRG